MINKDVVVYISGPMSGIKNENKEAFNDMEKLLKELFGCTVLNPARHPIGLGYHKYMKYAKIDIENSHVIVLLKKFGRSPGAIREIQWAIDNQLLLIMELEIREIICKNVAE